MTKKRKKPEPPTPTVRPNGYSRRTVAGICVFLAMAVFSVFGQTLRFDFVTYDDNEYVYENPFVLGGLSLKGITWAFTHFHSNNWHPVTWLSHMLDCEFYGLNAGGHHFTSVLFHAATAILLFLMLLVLVSGVDRSPGERLWCSAFIAIVFAIHPLRAESVAWVAERKDLLCGLFFMLTLLAYARYATKPFSVARYLPVVLFFALGLMSKPMLVTLPFVLLLLDYWPFGRFRGSVLRLILEKIPLFLMSIASILLTVMAQKNATVALEGMSLADRIENALVSYVVYVWQVVYPVGLTVFYPLPENGHWPGAAILSAVFLAAMTTGSFVLRKKAPYFLIGWLWYLGMLMPVIGVMQVGEQAHADRYTYLPQIGLYLIMAWGVADMTRSCASRRLWCWSVGSLAVAFLAFTAWTQTAYWRDSVTIWTRTLSVTSRNSIAHNNLGVSLLNMGRHEEAGSQFMKALEIYPVYASANYNLANVFAAHGQPREAIEHYRKALEAKPDFGQAHSNMGVQLFAIGDINNAIEHYRRALVIEPGLAEPHFNIANLLAAQGMLVEAIEHYRSALEISPDRVQFLINLALIYATCPDASLRDGAKAIELAERANTLSGGGSPLILATLAAAYAEDGRFPNAVETARRARDLAAELNDKTLVDTVSAQLQLYEMGLPYHDSLSAQE